MVLEGRNCSLRVEGGRILEVLPGVPNSNRWIVRKSFDLNVKNSESVVRLSRAAQAGGVGRFLLIPEQKPIYNKLHLSYNLKRASEVGFPIFVAIEGIHGEELTEIATLHKKGARGIYIQSDQDLNLICRVFEYGELLGIPIIVRCHNRSWDYGVMNEGEMAYRLGVSGIPGYVEAVEVAKIYQLSRHFNATVFFPEITTKESLEILKGHPENIWVGVPIDNLYFTDRQLEGFNTLYKTFPPLRGEEDREALLEGVRTGEVEIISSNHIAALQKDLPLEIAEPGIGKLDIFSQLAYSLPLPVERIEEAVAINPAKLFRVESELEGENFLQLEFGEWPVDPAQFHSRTDQTPYPQLKAQIRIAGGEEEFQF